MQHFVIYSTPIGLMKIIYDEQHILRLDYLHEPVDDLGEKSPVSEQFYQQLCEFFAGQRKVFDFPYKLEGTPFQKAVWNALLTIPYGETCSYKDIAKRIGNPKACRAIGMANNRNPISIAIPCHRVIGANGKLVGYGGGLDKKIALLELEKKYR